MTMQSVDDARFELEAAFRKAKSWPAVVENWRQIAEQHVDADPEAIKKWFDGDPANARYFEQAIDDVLSDTAFLMRRAQAWRNRALMTAAMDEIVAEADDARIDRAQSAAGEISLDDKIGL